ncbi:CALCIUM-BINDING PROTEIN KIC [Salix koriyanagi]|uniref:CALCIUM-BINDING PROTEIN KIC n=1 Tax=Salix koriyanagi TaxID=2511006 RepID=A0A9Q0U4A6_9ROSI|nr:CALCIUM-BINDING PROTEIN KIC [Salix koriyanagi]
MEKDQIGMKTATSSEYQDFLPIMADKLGVETFVSELCGGFRLLADPEKGLITSESLRRNSALLGMEGMSKEDAEAMVREGDRDGDGVPQRNRILHSDGETEPRDDAGCRNLAPEST